MNTKYAEVFAEVDMILNIMPKEIINKIPLSFRKLISDKKSKTYKSSAIDDMFITEEHLKDETKNVLSIIYRKYLCEPEIREILEVSDINELNKLNIEVREKYNPNKIFNPKPQCNINIIDNLPPDIYKEKWYQKFFKSIISIFKSK